MYCEWGGMYVRRLDALGHENDDVCIVIEGGAYARRLDALGHENDAVCIVSGGGLCEEIGRFGTRE